jgi:hypothetical protein
MDKQKEIQTAFVLWKELLELAYLLQGIYGYEFFKLIRNDPSCRPPGITKDDLIPF